MTGPEELLDIKQAARFLQVSETSLRRWTNSGQLPCLRVGRKRERRFRRSALLAFMDHQPADSTAPEAISQTRRHVIVAGVSLPYGTHLCALYADDIGRDRLALAFLADGFVPGSVSYLASSPEARTAIIGQLARGRGSLTADMDAGRLVVSKYFPTAAEQYEYWERCFLTALGTGADSLRVVGDMTSCTDAGMSLDDLVEYEAGYDRLIARRFPVVTLCLYDVRQFQSLDVVRALKGHAADTFRYPAERLLA